MMSNNLYKLKPYPANRNYLSFQGVDHFESLSGTLAIKYTPPLEVAV